VGCEWRSSIDGLLSSSCSFETSKLSAGTHKVYFRVKDDRGEWSESAVATLEVKPQSQPTPPTPQKPDVRIESIETEKSSYRPGEYITVYIHLKNYGTAASDGKVCYRLRASYHTDWYPNSPKCVDVGTIPPGGNKTIVDSGYDGLLYGWHGPAGKLYIDARLESVDGESVKQPPVSTHVDVYIDDVITKLPVEIEFRTGDVKSYRVEYTDLSGNKVLLEFTIRKIPVVDLPWPLPDWIQGAMDFIWDNLPWPLPDFDPTPNVKLEIGLGRSICQGGEVLKFSVPAWTWTKWEIKLVHGGMDDKYLDDGENTPNHRLPAFPNEKIVRDANNLLGWLELPFYRVCVQYPH